MGTQRTKIVTLLEKLLPIECLKETSVKGLTLVRMDRGFQRSPRSYSAGIIFLAQGEKRVYLGKDTLIYDPEHYLVLSVPMPIECEAIVRHGRPLLGFYITIDPNILGEILLELDEGPYQTYALPRGIYGASITEELENAGIRLIKALFSQNRK